MSEVHFRNSAEDVRMLKLNIYSDLSQLLKASFPPAFPLNGLASYPIGLSAGRRQHLDAKLIHSYIPRMNVLAVRPAHFLVA